MKKIICAILAVILMTAAVSCSANNESEDSAKNTSGTTDAGSGTVTDSDETGVSDTSAETDDPESSKAEPYSETFSDGSNSVTIIYPRFGDGEHELFDISLRGYAVQMYQSSGMMPEDGALYEITSLEITYESDILVSAVAEGHIINTTAGHDSYFAYTVNADPATGRIYLDDELIGDLDTVKSAFADERFTQSYGIDGLMNEITYEDITQSWRSDYGVFPDLYFTDDSFGVMAELAHALGGYAGFEIQIAEASEMINDTAKGLLKK